MSLSDDGYLRYTGERLQHEFAANLWAELHGTFGILIIKLLGGGASPGDRSTVINCRAMEPLLSFTWGEQFVESFGRPPYALARLGRGGIIAFTEGALPFDPLHYVTRLEQLGDDDLRMKPIETLHPPDDPQEINRMRDIGSQSLALFDGFYRYDDVLPKQLRVTRFRAGLQLEDRGDDSRGTEIAILGHGQLPVDPGDLGEEIQALLGQHNLAGSSR